MPEREMSHEELEAFRSEIREAIESTVSLITSGQEEGYFTIDPFSLGLGVETLSESEPIKQQIVREELYRKFEIEDKIQPLITYQTGAENELEVHVFEGQDLNEEEEEKHFYLHELKHPEGELDWHISATPSPIEII